MQDEDQPDGIRPAAISRQSGNALVHSTGPAAMAPAPARSNATGWLILSGVVAVCAIVLLMHQQRSAMTRQLREMQTQSEIMSAQLQALQQTTQQNTALMAATTQLAESSRQTADAAHQAASAADQALRMTQRAYLVAQPPAQINLTGRPLQVQTVFFNQGATAAQDVATYSGQAIFQEPLGVHVDFSKAPRTPHESEHDIVAPHGEKTVGYISTEGINPNDLHQLTTGHGSLIVYGSAAYNDIFAKPHFAHFCRLYQFDATGAQVRSQACADWNEAD